VARRPIRDPIAVLEAAYTWDPDEDRWLGSVAASVSAYQVGGGVIAYTVCADTQTRVVATAETPDASSEIASTLHRVTRGFPVPLARALYAPAEFVGNAGYRARRIAQEATEPIQAAAQRARERVPGVWGLISGNPQQRAMMLGFPRADSQVLPDEAFPTDDSRVLGLVGAHLGAALRLRLSAAATGHHAPPDAVLNPNGKLLHAEGAAATLQARQSLVAAVIDAERARGALRRAAPEEAVEAWRSLVRGQWTIVDTVERDGKRLLLARRNPLQKRDLLALNAGEQDVAWLAALGHSNKYMAYQLGIPTPTVASRLRRAMRKLRATSRAELISKLGVMQS